MRVAYQGIDIIFRTPASILTHIAIGLALTAVAALALWLYARGWAPNRDIYAVQGVSIDVTNGAVDWGTLAAQGADFAYIRAIDGGEGRDPSFAANWQDARRAGLRYGATIDFSLCRPASDQATRFLATVPRDNAALPPVVRLTFDPACFSRPERETVLREVQTLLELIENHSGKPAILNIDAAFDAHYDVGGGINRTLWLDGNFFPPDYASRRWVMWTASDMRHIEGVDGPVRWNVVAP